MTESIKNNYDRKTRAITHETAAEEPNLDGDRLNFYLLILLYIVQGFPIGLSMALPIILQSKKMVTYGDQASFSVALWPYSLKLIWAPIVDALYVQWIGKRKSWLLPLQLLMGLLLLYMARNIDDWLPETGQPNLKMLIIVIFIINFLSATQDIVVDGWSLTMLKKKNVGYASTCNSVGVPLGMFIGNVCFVLLVSEPFCNRYFRTTPGTGGIITMKSFLHICGFTTLMITTLVGMFKKEKDNRLEKDYVRINVFQSYKLLWDILRIPRIVVLAIALLTARIGYTAMDSVSNLKLIDSGVSKDDIMLITTLMYAVKFTMPIYVSKYITGPKPMTYYLKLTPFRLLWAIAYIVLIYFTPSLIHTNGAVDVPVYYYFIIGLICLMNEMMSFFMLLTLFAFFCRLSDPRFGGTYMTLFNTFYYLGFLLSNTFVLKLVAVLTFSKCSNDAQNNCSTSHFNLICTSNGGNCEVYVDGYYIAIVICMVVGFVWYGIFRNIIKKYQSLSHLHWLVNINSPNTEEVKEACIITST